MRWSSDSSVLIVWESPLEYKIQIYTLTGQCLSSYTPYQWALGIRICNCSQNGQFIAIGSFDQKVCVLSYKVKFLVKLNEYNLCI